MVPKKKDRHCLEFDLRATIVIRKKKRTAMLFNSLFELLFFPKKCRLYTMARGKLDVVTIHLTMIEILQPAPTS